jgi:hypothetical protein
MAKDKTQGMQRIDLRIPDHTYNEIEKIAIANNLPFSPTTKPNRDGTLKTDKQGNIIQPKVSVSPIILDLINLGLRAIASGGENSDKLGDKTRNREYQINSQIDISEIEKKIINTLSQKIEGIVSDKVNEALNKLTNNFTSKLTDIEDIEELTALKLIEDTNNEESNNIELVKNKLPSNNSQIVTAESDKNEVEISEINHNSDNGQIEINLINDTENNTLLELPILPLEKKLEDKLPNKNVTEDIENNLRDKEKPLINHKLDNLKINEDNEKPLINNELDNLKVNEDNKIDSDIKSYEEAVIEIKRLKKEGLGNTAIAKELTGKYFTKQGKTNWSDTQVRRILN